MQTKRAVHIWRIGITTVSRNALTLWDAQLDGDLLWDACVVTRDLPGHHPKRETSPSTDELASRWRPFPTPIFTTQPSGSVSEGEGHLWKLRHSREGEKICCIVPGHAWIHGEHLIPRNCIFNYWQNMSNYCKIQRKCPCLSKGPHPSFVGFRISRKRWASSHLILKRPIKGGMWNAHSFTCPFLSNPRSNYGILLFIIPCGECFYLPSE